MSTGAKVGGRLSGASESINAPIRAPVSTAPRLELSSGTLEALKWLALLLMTLDHVNKHLLHASVPELFAVGRLALPLFGFVLGYNLARPGVLASGGYSRTARRLAIFASLATIPFIALGGLGGLPDGLGLLSPAKLVAAGPVDGCPRLAVRHQPQPVGSRRVAAHLCSRTGQNKCAPRPARLLRLLPNTPDCAVGPGTTAVAGLSTDASQEH